MIIIGFCALAWVVGILALRYALTRSAARDQAAAERTARRVLPVTHPAMRPTRDYFSRVPLPRPRGERR
ncbi:hypothetical protein ACFUJR_27905 [Streptomyces sp. NPDC057271]|uniref:hypothetical protein n=1 Tax=unclassified Streptomyces TaxID=2593676 RepID=UPI0036260AB1